MLCLSPLRTKQYTAHSRPFEFHVTPSKLCFSNRSSLSPIFTSNCLFSSVVTTVVRSWHARFPPLAIPVSGQSWHLFTAGLLILAIFSFHARTGYLIWYAGTRRCNGMPRSWSDDWLASYLKITNAEAYCASVFKDSTKRHYLILLTIEYTAGAHVMQLSGRLINWTFMLSINVN